VTDASGLVLVTRRALVKRSWPGVWTNAFCGHPGPGEGVVDAAVRRGAEELGLRFAELPRVVLPAFSYRAVDDAGTQENELCPVLVATLAGEAPAPTPDASEVAAWRWVDPDDLAVAVAAAPWAFSPWSVAQLDQLGHEPGGLRPALGRVVRQTAGVSGA